MQKNKIKIGAGIITYNPEIKLLNKNIESINEQVDKLIIFDNGSQNLDDIKKVCEKYNIELLRSNKNIGIAAGLNKVFNYYIQNQDSWWILTLDQDTVCQQNLVKKLKLHCKENVGIVSPNFVNRGAEKEYSIKKDIEYVEWTITSASLTSVYAWKKIGGFDENLFIDSVDTDFGMRLNKNGFLVIKDNSVSISHKIGNSQLRRFLGKTYCIQNHNSFRKYYIARNPIIVAYKNCTFKRVIRSYLGNIKSIIRVIIFENNKCEKIFSIIKGTIDGTKYILNLKRRKN